MPQTGWITTNALADAGTGHDNLQLSSANYLANGIITAAKLAAGAFNAGGYGLSTYGDASYG